MGLAGRKDLRARKTRSIGAKEKAYKKGGRAEVGTQSPRSLAAVSRRCEKDRDSAISRLIPHVRAREKSLIKKRSYSVKELKIKKICSRIKRAEDY